jgi:hypothetical protein
MTTWNTAVVVVELIEAGSAQEAILALEKRLRAAGYDPYDDADSHYPNAFESEDS